MKTNDFDIAVYMLRDEYAKAKKDENVRKPLAYALHAVWKYVDRIEKERVVEVGDEQGL